MRGGLQEFVVAAAKTSIACFKCMGNSNGTAHLINSGSEKWASSVLTGRLAQLVTKETARYQPFEQTAPTLNNKTRSGHQIAVEQRYRDGLK